MYRIAILGTENDHAYYFSKALAPVEGEKKYPDFELVGVYGDKTRQDSIQGSQRVKESSTCPYFADHYDDFVGKVDAVMVTARYGANHLKFARKYIEAGIPVWLDKPITCSCEEAIETANLLKKHGNIFGGGSTLAFADEILTLGQTAKENADTLVGGHVTAPIDMLNEYGNFWFYSSHLIQMILSVFGYGMRSVYATSGADYVDAFYEYDNFTVSAHFGTGYTVTIYLNEHRAIASPVTVNGSCYGKELAAFIDSIRAGKSHMTMAQLMTPVFVIDATIRSFTEKRRINITVPEL